MTKILYRRPAFIGFRVVDPFDGFQLLQTYGPFRPDLCADGYYRREREGVIEAAKLIAQNLHRRGYRPALRLRQPKVHLLLA